MVHTPRFSMDQTVSRDFIRVDDSPIHGIGVFAKHDIPKGTRVIAYLGERETKAQFIEDARTQGRALTYVLNVDETHAIDGAVGGNEARFVNHSCAPNCEIYVFDGVPYLYAMMDITEGTELTFDYQLQSMKHGRLSQRLGREFYPCHCGASHCRGTLLSPKALWPRALRVYRGACPDSTGR